jgi:hypothetical protein
MLDCGGNFEGQAQHYRTFADRTSTGGASLDGSVPDIIVVPDTCANKQGILENVVSERRYSMRTKETKAGKTTISA